MSTSIKIHFRFGICAPECLATRPAMDLPLSPPVLSVSAYLVEPLRWILYKCKSLLLNYLCWIASVLQELHFPCQHLSGKVLFFQGDALLGWERHTECVFLPLAAGAEIRLWKTRIFAGRRDYKERP